MISKNRIKYIISLQKKKTRDEERVFIIEGDKLVKEFLASEQTVKNLIAKPEFLGSLNASSTRFVNEIEEVSYEELKLISTLKTPHNALAIIPMPEDIPATDNALSSLSVALDCVQDPGNFGTIIRAAAWFGIKNIVCSNDCVDVYNPKVIQASMGAILNVAVSYCDLKEFLFRAAEKRIKIFGTVLEGISVYDHKLAEKGVILLGNESKGISEELMPFINEKIMIPKFNNARFGIDSLNVGMAASVVFSEFRRRSTLPTD
jgi:TrmH family RNA methyltransferase